MADRRQVVYLLHGVDSCGVWYPVVASGLEPFFRCVPLRYKQYDWMGKWKVVSLGGGFTIAAVCVLLLLALAGGLSTIVLSTVAFIATISAGASLGEMMRRHRALQTVASQMGAIGPTVRPERHVVAHSFGTYLFGRLLMKAPATRHDRVVLIGSILPQKFDWMALWRAATPNRRPFRFIRNEHSQRDFVVGLAGTFRIFSGRCGPSGKTGFVSCGLPPLAVHDVPNAWGPCPNKSALCETEPILHNHDLPHHDHNAWFLMSDHAKMLWMPYLWGLDPADYIAFVHACHEVELAHYRGDFRQAELLASELHNRVWPWFTVGDADATMSDYAVDRLWAAGFPEDRLDESVVAYVVYWAAVFVATAHRGNDPQSSWCVNPPDAMATAARAAVRRHGAT